MAMPPLCKPLGAAAAGGAGCARVLVSAGAGVCHAARAPGTLLSDTPFDCGGLWSPVLWRRRRRGGSETLRSVPKGMQPDVVLVVT